MIALLTNNFTDRKELGGVFFGSILSLLDMYWPTLSSFTQSYPTWNTSLVSFLSINIIVIYIHVTMYDWWKLFKKSLLFVFIGYLLLIIKIDK
jgi:galactitol-specific phosphotransferase system IIC component